ncbi:MAG: 30S ribosomal protein S8 [Rickettsiales bacterium]|nr:30S ribosomal protein S8 [Rickettsiales bacterium]
MAINDLTSDMIATLNNGQRAKLAGVTVRSNKLNKNVLSVLQNEGFIDSFEEVEERKNVKFINVKLKYYQGQPVIKKIKRVSTPGLRAYSAIKSLGKSFSGLGVKVLSTSKGVMSDYEARKLNIGGEIVCEVF